MTVTVVEGAPGEAPVDAEAIAEVMAAAEVEIAEHRAEQVEAETGAAVEIAEIEAGRDTEIAEIAAEAAVEIAAETVSVDERLGAIEAWLREHGDPQHSTLTAQIADLRDSLSLVLASPSPPNPPLPPETLEAPDGLVVAEPSASVPEAPPGAVDETLQALTPRRVRRFVAL